MITTNLTGNLGNHMWQYAVCRCVAEKLGYEWGINKHPTHDYFNGNNQMDFMDVDFGKSIENIQFVFCERWININHIDNVNITMLDPRIYNIPDNTIILGDNNAYGALLQSEHYILGRRKNILKWFEIKENINEECETLLKEKHGIVLNDNTCVINFRGGEYRGLFTVLLRKEYWRDSVDHMRKLNPDMKFLAITDDMELCSQYMPEPMPIIHENIAFDFWTVNNAKWLIISNSSFGWWAAWLNLKSKLTIAPKYWARHNVSNGYWATGDVYSRFFKYLDRQGNLFDYNSCVVEAENFYKTHNII